MKLNKYQKLAARTHNYKVSKKESLINYSLGLAGEAGETIDLIKKYLYHGHEVFQADICGELGDILWYVAMVAEVFGLSLDQVAEKNIDKLKSRYPSGFDPEASQKRK